jgi:hypothetical protein
VVTFGSGIKRNAKILKIPKLLSYIKNYPDWIPRIKICFAVEAEFAPLKFFDQFSQITQK